MSSRAVSSKLLLLCDPQDAHLLSLPFSVLAAHVLTRCSVKDLPRLAGACRQLRQLVADLPEATWQAAAGLERLPILHPLWRASSVRQGVAQQQRLAARLADPAAWVVDSPSASGARRWAVSPDTAQVTTESGQGHDAHGIHVVDSTTGSTTASLQLPGGCRVIECAFSWDSSSLATVFVVEPAGTREYALSLIDLRTGTQTTRLLLSVPAQAISRALMAWAPSAALLGVILYQQSAARLLLLTAADVVLGSIASHTPSRTHGALIAGCT